MKNIFRGGVPKLRGTAIDCFWVVLSPADLRAAGRLLKVRSKPLSGVWRSPIRFCNFLIRVLGLFFRKGRGENSGLDSICRFLAAIADFPGFLPTAGSGEGARYLQRTLVVIVTREGFLLSRNISGQAMRPILGNRRGWKRLPGRKRRKCLRRLENQQSRRRRNRPPQNFRSALAPIGRYPCVSAFPKSFFVIQPILLCFLLMDTAFPKNWAGFWKAGQSCLAESCPRNKKYCKLPEIRHYDQTAAPAWKNNTNLKESSFREIHER